MRIEISDVNALDGVTLGFRCVDTGISFPVTFLPEDATPRRDRKRGLDRPSPGVNLIRRQGLVVVHSQTEDLLVAIPSGEGRSHRIYGRIFAVQMVDGQFVLEVS